MLHHDEAGPAVFKSEKDTGNADGVDGVVLQEFPDEVLRQGLAHVDGIPKLYPGARGAARLDDERYAGSGGCGWGEASGARGAKNASDFTALLDDHPGFRQLQLVQISVDENDGLYLWHGCQLPRR